MKTLSIPEQVEKLEKAIQLVFDVEQQYHMKISGIGDIRHDGYQIRLQIAALIDRLKSEQQPS